MPLPSGGNGSEWIRVLHARQGVIELQEGSQTSGRARGRHLKGVLRGWSSCRKGSEAAMAADRKAVTFC